MAHEDHWREEQIRAARRRQAVRDWRNLRQLIQEFFRANRPLILFANLFLIVALLLWWFWRAIF